MSIIRWMGFGFVVLVLVLGLIQLVPFGHNHTNPPVVQEPSWISPQVHELAVRACYDCHSNETNWPWYSNVAPASWLTQNDIEEGRYVLNFSDWGRQEREGDEMGETIRDGAMPPWYYVALHPKAKLSLAEQEALIRGLMAIAGSVSASQAHERE